MRSHEVAVVLLDGALTLRRVYKNEKPDCADGGKSDICACRHARGLHVRILGKAVAFLNPNAPASPF
ncbi:MAG: hypothetical protein R2912_10885 [Eubacteriales bacterium]